MSILKHRPPAVEAPPERPRAVAACPLLPLPLGAPARSVAVLRELRAETPVEFFAAIDAQPIPHANWDAWLADDWAHVNARWDNLADGTARVFARMTATYEYAPHAMVQPLLSEITELTAVTLVNWRQELRIHAEAELALFGAKAGC